MQRRVDFALVCGDLKGQCDSVAKAEDGGDRQKGGFHKMGQKAPKARENQWMPSPVKPSICGDQPARLRFSLFLASRQLFRMNRHWRGNVPCKSSVNPRRTPRAVRKYTILGIFIYIEN